MIADLRELDRLTGGPGGARRVCWTAEWEEARDFLRGRLAEIDGVTVEQDEAANLWARLPGAREGTSPWDRTSTPCPPVAGSTALSG